MTELDMFPRGKTPTDKSLSASSKRKSSDDARTSSNDLKKGRKREAVGSPPTKAGEQDRDFLFGAPQTKPTQVPGKQSPGDSKTRQHSVRSSSGQEKGMGSGMLVERSGKVPRLEMVSFKKLSKGTLVLGVVFKVDEDDMVVSLTSSLTGVVRRKEVSDQFYIQAAAAGDQEHGFARKKRGRYFQDDTAGRISLTDLFRTGQVVRCSILSLVKEAKSRRIELSLRASVVNKGLSLSHLGKGCGVYGSVASAEDHGYVVTLGLEGVTAFLPAKDAPEGGLQAGQPVEAVIQAVKAVARTVTLSAKASLVASAVTSGASFDLRSIKPGMVVDATVKSLLPNGMLVGFLGYFTGCVDHNNMPVVSGDSKDEEGGWRSLFTAGNKTVRARVLIVDYANKTIRLTLRRHLLDLRAPFGVPPTGAILDGEVVRVDRSQGLLLRVPSADRDDRDPTHTPGGGAPATENVDGQSKQRRKSALAAREGGNNENSRADAAVGAYVHISRISDKRIDRLEKAYKPGQKVRCRITGAFLLEGWATASLQPSVLSAAVMSFQDLIPGAIVEGEVAAVKPFGLLIKLGQGVQALVPKLHLADATVKNPKIRFKEGARVKARVLTVDSAAKQATLTLKRSMVNDKRPAITSYEHLSEGVACTGFVNKVVPFGLHVNFYGNVHGLLPVKALTRHGIQDPAEAFTVGQVIGCILKRFDVTRNPPRLFLTLDVARDTEDMSVAADDETNANGGRREACPLSPGDVVSGKVSKRQDNEGAVMMDLSSTPIPKDSATSSSPRSFEGKENDNGTADVERKFSTVQGVLPHVHVGDHASLCRNLAARLTPGTMVDRLVVLAVSERGVPSVTMKPLLVSAMSSSSGGTSGAFVPREASGVSCGDLVAGFVSRVESFGVFVKFLGRFSALCPRSKVAEWHVDDPRGMFVAGDSVRCVVERVDEDTGRVVVTMKANTVPPSPALYLRSLLSETFATAGELASSWEGIEFGVTMGARVIGLKEYGVVLRESASKGGSSIVAAGGEPGTDAGRLMLCRPEHAMEGLEKGNEVKVRVLGVDLSKGVLDVTMDNQLVKAGRKKRRKAMAPLQPGDSVPVKVVLAKPTDKWAVVASPEGRLFPLQVGDFHCPYRTCEDAGLCSTADADDSDDPSSQAGVVKEFNVKVGDSFVSGVEGYWQSAHGEADTGSGGGNPYAGAVLVMADLGSKSKNRKNAIAWSSRVPATLRLLQASRRRSRGESLDLGDKPEDAVATNANPMKSGRVALGNITKETVVVCRVVSVHLDRLEVKVAVRYPKTYGPKTAPSRPETAEEDHSKGKEKKRRRGQDAPGASASKPVTSTPPVEAETIKGKGKGEKDDGGDDQGKGRQGHSKDKRNKRVIGQEAPPLTSTPPTDAEKEKEKGDDEGEGRGGSAADSKKIVWIRARVHCTAAGLPEVDAPSKVKDGDRDGHKGDDERDAATARLPRWHPLSKYHVGEVLKARVIHVKDDTAKNESSSFHEVFRQLELAVVSRIGHGSAEDEDESISMVSEVSAWWGERPPVKGQVYRGVITDVTDSEVLVALSTSVLGRIPVAHLGEDATVTEKFRSLFKRGMGLRGVVHSVIEASQRLILSLRGVPSVEELPDSALPALSPRSSIPIKEAKGEKGIDPDVPPVPVPGDIVEGAIDLKGNAWDPPCVVVRLEGGFMGRVCITEAAEEKAWKSDPLSRLKNGQRVKCRVLHPVPNRARPSKLRSEQKDEAKEEGAEGANGAELTSRRPGVSILELSLRESRLKPTLEREEAIRRKGPPEAGSMAKCYVASTNKGGCFVRLDGGVSGRVLLKFLADRFISDPSKEFPPGRLVAGKIISKDDATGNVSLTLRPSEIHQAMSWRSKSLAKGLKLEGTVTSVKDFGVFVQIKNSGVRGLCHRTEAADHPIEDLSKVYDVGDLVKAVVLKVDRKKKRLSLGLKPSYFEGDPDSSDEESAPPAQDGNKDVDDQYSDSDDEEYNDTRKEDAGETVTAMKDVDDDEDADRSSKRPRGIFDGGLSGASGRVVGNAFSLDFGHLGSMARAGGSSDEDDEDSDIDGDGDGEGGTGLKGHRSRKKAREEREEEKRIAAREKALQDEDAAPETVGDFERLLVASPNDSLLWVKYMAFKLSLAEVEGARTVAERGLKAVSFREEQERFNIWVSLMNLEHKFGNRATLKTVFERACQNSDPKKVYLHLAEVHGKAQETQECDEIFQAAVKKFRQSQQVWSEFQLSRLRRGDDAGAREILQRSLQSLPKNKHVAVISRFAQNEFEHGSVERGRLVFEGLMASYPKRLDLWNVYLDKEVKSGEIRAARNLLERLIRMDFNAKRMKSVFKKYLQFEMEYGNEAGVEAVKIKAKEYVASLAG